MDWGAEPGAAAAIAKELAEAGARTAAIEADLSGPDAPTRIFDEAEQRLGGPVTALVLSHAESVDSGLLDTTVEAFDRHFAVNSRASWLLIREYGLRFRSAPGTATGRIVALTSDHTVGNLPYGASKGALDRITLAAAHELAHLGVTANVVNPGPVDTGWMNDELRETLVRGTPLGQARHPAGHRPPGGVPVLPRRPVGQRPVVEEQRRRGFLEPVTGPVPPRRSPGREPARRVSASERDGASNLAWSM